MKKILLLLGSVIFTLSVHAADSDFQAVEEKLQTALQSDIRTDKEKARDRNRQPVETLKFFGLRDNMKVIELLPGGGWYTKLLAPVLRDKGKLYLAIGTQNVEKNVLKLSGFNKVEVLDIGVKPEREENTRFINIAPFEFGVKNVDMVLTFRNYHNFTPAGRAQINKAVFKALKPGGVYGVVDHTRRHMQSQNPENRRRVDPVLAIKEILNSGFEFVDYSDLHYKLDDELVYEVGRKTVTGNTDRFTLYFRKPE